MERYRKEMARKTLEIGYVEGDHWEVELSAASLGLKINIDVE